MTASSPPALSTSSTTPRTTSAATPLRPVTPAAILAARLAELAARAEIASALDESMRAELRELAKLATGLDPYLENMTSPESAPLATLVADTRTQDWPALRASGATGLEAEMLSGQLEGQFLQMLVHATRATRVLEIGMFTGYSALAMAEAMSPGGRVVACEIDERMATLARESFERSPAGKRIDVRVGPALDTLAELGHAGDRFDFVFLDADKSGYVDYFRALLELDLLAPHALFCVDNTLMQGEPWTGTTTRNGEAIARFNEVVAADTRVAQVLVPLRDGVTLIRRVPTPHEEGE